MKRFFSFIIACVILLSFVSCAGNDESRLDKSEISELRTEYPIYGKKFPELIEIAVPPLSFVKENSETFIFCEVMGEYETYKNSFAQFYEYPIKVISDTENLYNKGDELTITSNIGFIEYNPELKPGMRMVIPVSSEKEKTRQSYSVVGMFYVTEEDYVLSAFEETDSDFSGIKLDKLFEELKK